MREGQKRLLRGAAWPIRRLLDPRFEWGRAQTVESEVRLTQRLDDLTREMQASDGAIEAALGERIAAPVSELRRELEELRTTLSSSVVANAEALLFVGHELRRATEEASALSSSVFEAVDSQMEEVRKELAAGISDVREALAGMTEAIDGDVLRRAVGSSLEDVDERLAELLNYAESHVGFRAQNNLWVNNPVQVAYAPGEVAVSTVHERIVEVPYTFRALSRLAPGSRVLDVGSAESTVALSLATLGYRVTALDLRPYPFEHPLLDVVAAPLEEWEPPKEPFDAVISISAIEHFGLGAYGEEGDGDEGDMRALDLLRSLTRDDGILVMTVPFGRGAAATESERTYDRALLERLLRSWTIEDMTFVERQGENVWWRLGDGAGPISSRRYVALVTARSAPVEAAPAAAALDGGAPAEAQAQEEAPAKKGPAPARKAAAKKEAPAPADGGSEPSRPPRPRRPRA
jgi:SAM-dependent methyltransferase